MLALPELEQPVDFEVALPALHLHGSDGQLDLDATRRYAVRAAGTWVDRFIVSGSTTRGDLLAPAQRAELLDLWLDVVGALRLLACAWRADDLVYAEDRDVAPLAVMQGLANCRDACDFSPSCRRARLCTAVPCIALPCLTRRWRRPRRSGACCPKAPRSPRSQLTR